MTNKYLIKKGRTCNNYQNFVERDYAINIVKTTQRDKAGININFGRKEFIKNKYVEILNIDNSFLAFRFIDTLTENSFTISCNDLNSPTPCFVTKIGSQEEVNRLIPFIGTYLQANKYIRQTDKKDEIIYVLERWQRGES